MTRECTQDFNNLKKYIDGYRINNNLQEAKYVASAKRMHRAYYSLVNWSAEYQHQIKVFSEKYTKNSEIYIRLLEVISDIGASKFNWLNGSYKTSRMMLRSAIENFVRALISIENQAFLSEKSVYTLFENANTSKVFTQSKEVNKLYKNLHSHYKTLCMDTHTATKNNMESITSLIDYPKFNEKRSTETEAIFTAIVKDIVTLLCLIFSELFHQMHHRNKENILNSIPTSYKPIVLGIISEDN